MELSRSRRHNRLGKGDMTLTTRQFNNAARPEVDDMRPAAGEAIQRFIGVAGLDFFGGKRLNFEGFIGTKKYKRGHTALLSDNSDTGR